MKRKPAPASEKDPQWYKSAVIYELHVRSFHDSAGDGVGDFRGLTEKLGYLQDLGVTALWLLPFYPSPLRDDGYDIADYCSIHPQYGTLADFKTFLREAHRRGLRVITELVMNHTSDQHPWFQRARRSKAGSPWRDFYVWSKTAEEYRDARIIFKDFETSNWAWDPVASAYYWHRFYSHQPDLNYDNPLVHKEIYRALDFWLDMGIDGLRLDAVPYLYERDGTNCENLPETHEFLRRLRRHVDETYGDRMLLAEANQWPEDAVAYFGSGKGDECHVAFHFPLMPRLFMGVRMEDRVPIVDILRETPPIPETAQWALFLRNHDELTLEMVTDEERDYMYRVYAQDRRARINLGIRRRLAPLLGNDRKRIELLNVLLLSLPGTPVLYYGDEIAMGENFFLGDRNAMRTPMQWSADRNAGFSRANPQSLYLPVIVDPEYHYESVNVETQERNPHSLLWWMKRVLALRKRWKAFGVGATQFLYPENRKVLAFLRSTAEERILVVANLSRCAQPVALDLSSCSGLVPVEIFGRNPFPVIDEKPYFLTLGPHAFYWFSLEPRFGRAPVVVGKEGANVLEELSVASSWEEVVEEPAARTALERILLDYVRARRWFGGKARDPRSVEVESSAPVTLPSGRAFLSTVKVDYVQGEMESYFLPLAFASGAAADEIVRDHPHLAVARLTVLETGARGIVHDAVGSREFLQFLLHAVSSRRQVRWGGGHIVATPTPVLRALAGRPPHRLEPAVGRGEQSNTTVVYGDLLILKLFRRLQPGVNPDLDIGRFLTARRFRAVPWVAGSLEQVSEDSAPTTLGILHALVPEASDGWSHTLDVLGRYYERIRSSPPGAESSPVPTLPGLVGLAVPESAIQRLGTYVESARLLGQRTAELHTVLASNVDDPEFAPEPFTPHYQRSVFQSMRNLTMQNLGLLKARLGALPEGARADAKRVCDLEPECLKRLRTIVERKVHATRIRCHGDFHLGQVLYTGKDFYIIDFEGEPARSLSERRIKRSPLRDVAGMLRSFHYAAHAALDRQVELGIVSQKALPAMASWAQYWSGWASAIYLEAYLGAAGKAGFIPSSAEDLRALLGVFLLEKAIYELGYELNNRPTWVGIPLQGILQLVEAPAS